MSSREDAATVLAGCAFALFVLVALGLLSALAFWLCWNWIAPLFWAQAPHLSFWQAWGCTTLLGILASPFRATQTTEKSK